MTTNLPRPPPSGRLLRHNGHHRRRHATSVPPSPRRGSRRMGPCGSSRRQGDSWPKETPRRRWTAVGPWLRTGASLRPGWTVRCPPTPIPAPLRQPRLTRAGRFGDDPAVDEAAGDPPRADGHARPGRARRNQLAALLRGSLGLESDRLVAFGVAPRRRHSRRGEGRRAAGELRRREGLASSHGARPLPGRAWLFPFPPTLFREEPGLSGKSRGFPAARELFREGLTPSCCAPPASGKNSFFPLRRRLFPEDPHASARPPRGRPNPSPAGLPARAPGFPAARSSSRSRAGLPGRAPGFRSMRSPFRSRAGQPRRAPGFPLDSLGYRAARRATATALPRCVARIGMGSVRVRPKRVGRGERSEPQP